MKLTQIRATLQVYRQRVQQRRWLAEMDERQLRDIGVSLWEAQQEIRKPFWKA